MLKGFIRYSYLFGFLLCLPVAGWAFDNFDCIGTKPFWKLTISDKQFTFTEHSAAKSIMPAVEPKPSENMSIEHMRVFRTKLNNKEIIILIQDQSCIDGMSEDVFAYEGIYISADKVFHGCCSKKLLLTN